MTRRGAILSTFVSHRTSPLFPPFPAFLIVLFPPKCCRPSFQPSQQHSHSLTFFWWYILPDLEQSLAFFIILLHLMMVALFERSGDGEFRLIKLIFSVDDIYSTTSNRFNAPTRLCQLGSKDLENRFPFCLTSELGCWSVNESLLENSNFNRRAGNVVPSGKTRCCKSGKHQATLSDKTHLRIWLKSLWIEKSGQLLNYVIQK